VDAAAATRTTTPTALDVVVVVISVNVVSDNKVVLRVALVAKPAAMIQALGAILINQ
jgi:hypothetical protein